MINTHWLELLLSQTNFHGPKGVRAIEVRMYILKLVSFEQHGPQIFISNVSLDSMFVSSSSLRKTLILLFMIKQSAIFSVHQILFCFEVFGVLHISLFFKFLYFIFLI